MSFPLYLVDNGSGLREDVKTLTNYYGSCGYVDMPASLQVRDRESEGFGNEYEGRWGV